MLTSDVRVSLNVYLYYFLLSFLFVRSEVFQYFFFLFVVRSHVSFNFTIFILVKPNIFIVIKLIRYRGSSRVAGLYRDNRKQITRVTKTILGTKRLYSANNWATAAGWHGITFQHYSDFKRFQFLSYIHISKSDQLPSLILLRHKYAIFRYYHYHLYHTKLNEISNQQ